METTEGSGWTRAASVAFGLLAAGTWMFALLVAGMRCDDVCETGGRPTPRAAADWRQYGDATQWTEIGALAWATLALAAAAIVLVYVGRRRDALLAVVLHAALSLRLGALLDAEVVVTSFAGASRRARRGDPHRGRRRRRPASTTCSTLRPRSASAG